MAKRRAEESVLLDFPVKRRFFPPVCSVGVKLDSMAPAGGVSPIRPPSLLTFLGSRCRKRPLYFNNEEADGCSKMSPLASGKRVKDVLQEPSSGSFQNDWRPCALSRNKRSRENSVGLDTASPSATDKTFEDSSDEDGTYNSFQYWRVPLPKVDLSLLEDSRDHSPKKDKAKGDYTTSDAMET